MVTSPRAIESDGNKLYGHGSEGSKLYGHAEPSIADHVACFANGQHNETAGEHVTYDDATCSTTRYDTLRNVGRHGRALARLPRAKRLAIRRDVKRCALLACLVCGRHGRNLLVSEHPRRTLLGRVTREVTAQERSDKCLPDALCVIASREFRGQLIRCHGFTSFRHLMTRSFHIARYVTSVETTDSLLITYRYAFVSLHKGTTRNAVDGDNTLSVLQTCNTRRAAVVHDGNKVRAEGCLFAKRATPPRSPPGPVLDCGSKSA